MRRRRALSLLAALCLSLGGCAEASEDSARPSSDEGESSGSGTQTSDEGSGASELVLEDVATDLDTVWAMAFAPDGSLWFTERGGRLGHMTLQADGSFAAPEFEDVAGVVEQGEGGLMGLAIDEAGRRFVMFTSTSDNRIVELRGDGSQKVLVSGIRSGSIHNGGRLAIGADGELYATTGDAGDRSLPRRDGLNGRILRIDRNSGDVAVVSTGHRNPQGLCFDGSGNLFSTEHGPDRGDEVNLIEEGADYGWPETEGTGIANWTPTIAPAGCVVYQGAALPELQGRLIFTTLKARSARQLDVSDDRRSAREIDPLEVGDVGRLRDVVEGPDGFLYLATSNRDGRGDPGPADDRIIRLTQLPA